jgi:hypothetical protein
MAGIATYEREAAALQRQIRALRLGESPARKPPAELAEIVGIPLDPWQLELLGSSWQQALLNCSRQSGKSTVSALMGISEVLYTPGATVLIVAPSDRQSALLFRTAIGMYRALGGDGPADVETRRSLELANGSQLHALPGKEHTIRGFSGVDLLIVDEASRVPDELYQAIRPMLAVSGGRLIALSTPWGKRGWWHAAWNDHEAPWYRVRVPATECPRIDPAWLEIERRSLPALVYEAEYLCEFHDTDDQLYASDLVDAAVSADVRPLEFAS